MEICTFSLVFNAGNDTLYLRRDVIQSSIFALSVPNEKGQTNELSITPVCQKFDEERI